MTKEESEQISSEIAGLIANEASYIDYSPKDVKRAKQAFSREQSVRFEEAGLLQEDFELFYVMNRFKDALKLSQRADAAYLKALFDNARKFSISEFYENPYIRNIQVPEVRIGDYLLTNAAYDRGEFFQYDMPDLSADMVVLKIGFFTGKVHFPSLYEGVIPWMSVCPSEIYSMRKPIEKAHGKVLVLGLGLSYYPYMVSLKDEVRSITIVEKQPEIIEIFENYLLPQFKEKNKIHVVHDDAFTYLESVREGEYDFCFADIWENQIDGAQAYLKIKPQEIRLAATEFTYWIEDSIKYYISIMEKQPEN